MKKSKDGAYSSLHNGTPDYTRSRFEFSEELRARIYDRLVSIYGEESASGCMPELVRICQVYYAHKPDMLIEWDKNFEIGERFTEKDVILITYGDLISGKGENPLNKLAKFCDKLLKDGINTLHILPFFPYSSDRGFSIIDFQKVDPEFGSWQDISVLDDKFELMFDAVINHISSQSKWFREFLNGNAEYENFFISYDSPDELTQEDRESIFRPRTSDVLSEFQTLNGPKYVWTTFSSDQIDLNYGNPKVLLAALNLLLLYIRQGANIIRLDAVAYLWSAPGSSCVHQEQTHQIIKLFRDVLNSVAPRVALITETNVPHKDNISYFGNGYDEAHMIYNFTLPPLVLHTFYREDATALTDWAQTLSTPSPGTHFFNFLDSHDGIGLLGAKGILPEEDIDYIVQMVEAHGGIISYKSAAGGAKIPYEMNITWYSAINNLASGDDVLLQVKRFVASRAIAVVLQGVPGIYMHSIIGSENDVEAVKTKKSNRAINRSTIDAENVFEKLEDKESKLSILAEQLRAVIKLRVDHSAFHPNGPQRVLTLSPDIFSVLRTSTDGSEQILSLISVVNHDSDIKIVLDDIGVENQNWIELLSGCTMTAGDVTLDVTLHAYDTLFLMPTGLS